MDHHQYTVEFRIFGNTLDPGLITRELGLEPCQVRTPGGSRFEGRTDRGMWAYNGPPDAPVEWRSLEEGLTFVLGTLWPYRQQVAQFATSAELIWWCGHFQSSIDGGPTLSPDLLKKLGEFGADLYIDNYFSPSPDS